MITVTRDYSVFVGAANALRRTWRKIPGVTAVTPVRNARPGYRAGQETQWLVVSATEAAHTKIASAYPDAHPVLHRGH